MCFGEMIDVYAGAFSEMGIAKAYLDAHHGSALEMREAIRSRDAERIRDTWESTTGVRPDDSMLAEIMKMLEGT